MLPNSTSNPPQLPEMTQVWQETLNWQPSALQQEKFQQLYELILAGNAKLNLTRITEPVEFWEKHLWDSLRGVACWLREGEQKQDAAFKAIDIGTGAGFPGVPVALAFPHASITLLDSTRKKMAFLRSLLAEMGIENATALVDRVEAIAQHPQHRGAYSLATIRAVAAAPVCAEYALPLLKVGGIAVLYRGQWTTDESDALQQAVQQLGGVIDSCEEFTTPMSQGVRHCLYLRKLKPTPAQFPRSVGIPLLQPLPQPEEKLRTK